jgi:metal-responsive CopG/Arc/MetJ family transcriptional regulator
MLFYLEVLKMIQPTISITVNLPPDMARKATTIAAAKGISRAELVRRAIAAYLQKSDKSNDNSKDV